MLFYVHFKVFHWKRLMGKFEITSSVSHNGFYTCLRWILVFTKEELMNQRGDGNTFALKLQTPKVQHPLQHGSGRALSIFLRCVVHASLQPVHLYCNNM